jgi:sugar phosphate isomerase/epimerase
LNIIGGIYMKTWQLGTSSALFGPDTIEGKLHECHAAGLKYVEIGVKNSDGKLREYVQDLVREAKEENISIWSIHLPFGNNYDISEADTEKRVNILKGLAELIDLAAPLKPSVAVIHGSYEPIKTENREANILACIESLEFLVDKCSSYGIKLAIECLPRTCIGNCSNEVLRILREVPGLSVCFDTNHLTIESPMEFVKKVGKHIISTHVSDYDGIDERHWLPGKGCIDWHCILSSLETAGYDGPIMFEVVNKADRERVTPKILSENWHTLTGNFEQKSSLERELI